MHRLFLLFLILTGLVVDLGSAQSLCPNRCPADVVFLIDESSSITPYNFDTYVKPFMADLTLGINIRFNVAHLGLVHFADEWATAIDFNYTDPKATNGALAGDYIRDMKFQAGNTALKMALELAYHQIMLPSARRPLWNKGIAAYAIIITDGVATDGDVAPIAREMNQAGIAIYVIGVGTLLPNQYLLELTNDPARIFTVKDWTELGPKLLQDIENATCCPANFTTPTPRK